MIWRPSEPLMDPADHPDDNGTVLAVELQLRRGNVAIAAMKPASLRQLASGSP